MAGRKQILAEVLYRVRFFDIHCPVRGSQLIVLTYHRIRSDSPDFETRFDSEVYGPTASEFTEHVKWLSQHTRILSEQDLLDCLNGGDFPEGRSVLITFDDAYRDNYELAYPIMKRYGIPAIFFIPTGFVETRRLGWWDIIACLIKQTSMECIRFKGREIPLDMNRSDVINFFQEQMKLKRCEETEDLVNDLATECRVAMPEDFVQDAEIMNWDQIREVRTENIAIGSHTHSHRVLATLDASAQIGEMVLSKEMLEREIREEVRSIAYPVGSYEHFTGESKLIAAQCGYRLGFSFYTGINKNCCGIDRFDIRRIHAPREVSLLAAIINFPRIFRWGWK